MKKHPTKDKAKGLKRVFKNIKLSEQIFWSVILVVLASMLGSMISDIVSGLEFKRILPTAISILIILIIISLATIKKHYNYYYTIFSIVIGGICIPLILLFGRGNFSNMAVLIIAAILLSSVNIHRKSRLYCFTFAFLTNMGVLLYTYFFNREAFGDTGFDAIIKLALASLSILLVLSKIIDGYDRITNILTRHMDINEIDTMLLTDSTSRAPVGKIYKTAVLFADISNFTMLSETMAPDVVARFLNVFFNIADESIHKHNGVIDKYIGDCVMAFWMDKNGDGEAAINACRAALDIRQRLVEVVEKVNEEFGCDLECSIGINYGDAIVGDVGSVNRQDFTVIGDAVNTASRLESIAPGGTIYLSQSVAELADKVMDVHHVPKKVVLKGKMAPVDIYTLDGLEKKNPDEISSIMQGESKTGFIMYVLGSRGSFSIAGKRYAEFGGETSCYVLKRDDYAIIIDCGSGLHRARDLFVGCKKIDILLTHLHYDHIMGLLDWSVFPQDAKIRFFGNFSEWSGEGSLHQILRPPYWPVDLIRGETISIEKQKKYTLNDDVTATFYKATHPDAACLIVINIQNKRICVMADCENPHDLPDEEVVGASIVMYDGMYEDQFYSEHVGWGHSTWESGVRLAIEKKVDRLVITHHSTRNSDERLRGLEKKAQEMYAATTFAKAGDRFPI